MNAITLGLVPVTTDAGTMLALHEVAEELAQIMGGAVEIRTASSHEAFEDDFATGRSELVWSSPALALCSPRMRSAVPLVCSVREGVAFYHSVLVVRQSSPILGPLGLRGARAAWVARTSASGYIFPRIALAGHGIDPSALFSREEFLGAHGAVVDAVRRGDADVGATFAVFERGDATRPLIRAGHHDASDSPTLDASRAADDASDSPRLDASRRPTSQRPPAITLSKKDTSPGATPAAEARAGDEPLRVLLATPPIPSDLFLASRALHDDHGPLLVRALEALTKRVPRALQTAFGAEALVPTGERELTELRRQLADAEAMGLFFPT